MTQKCLIANCTAMIPSGSVMCLKHWRMVPKEMQRDVWRHYRAGDVRQSLAYQNAAKAAAQAVEEKLLKKAERSDSPQLF